MENINKYEKRHFEGLKNTNFFAYCHFFTYSDPHAHQFIELTYLLQGQLEHCVDGRTDILEAGDYFILETGTRHSMMRISDEPVRKFNVFFYPVFMDFSLLNKSGFQDVLDSTHFKFAKNTLSENVTNKTFHDEDGTVLQLIENIISEQEKKQYGYLEAIYSQLFQIIIKTIRKADHIEQSPAYNDVILKMIKIINERYNEKLRLIDISNEVGYSTNYLSTQFSKSTNMQFYKYLQKVRIENACKLLEQTDMLISDVAPAVGINDVKFFYKIFKQTTGMSPTQFRKNSRFINSPKE